MRMATRGACYLLLQNEWSAPWLRWGNEASNFQCYHDCGDGVGVSGCAFSAQVIGIVKNADDSVVQGVRIRPVDTSVKTLGQGLSGADGR